MAKYATRKSTNANVAETLERKRIRAAKYANLSISEIDSDRALRTLARELGATLVSPVYVPSMEVALDHTANPARGNVRIDLKPVRA
jgi:hypothetical protein